MFGDEIKRHRKRLGLSQAEFGKRIGTTRSAISQIESGISKGMKPENLCRASDLIGISVHELVTGKPKKGLKIAEDSKPYNPLDHLPANIRQLVESTQALNANQITAVINLIKSFTGTGKKLAEPPSQSAEKTKKNHA